MIYIPKTLHENPDTNRVHELYFFNLGDPVGVSSLSSTVTSYNIAALLLLDDSYWSSITVNVLYSYLAFECSSNEN